MSDSPIFSDQSIVYYLLGVLPEADTDRIEEQSICDPVFFERLEMAQEGLIRLFLDRKLSPADEALFTSKYLAIPALRRKVEFAEDLRRAAREAVSKRPPISPRITWFAWPRVAVSVLAGTGLVAVAVAVLTFGNHSRRSSSSQPSGDIQGTPRGVVSLLLFPGVEKGGSARDHRLMITPDTREIRLEFQVPGNDAPIKADVDVMRVAAPEDERRAAQTIEGRPTTAGRRFALTLMPAALPDGSYIAYLRRWPASAHPEPEESFVFSVGRQASATEPAPPR
jgi:hypothetical protein